MKAIAEAPSKVIVAGEHFVVHGAWALAVATGRKTQVTLSDSDKLSVASDRFDVSESGALKPLASVVGNMARRYSFDPSIRVTVKSDVPPGAGMGSSASTLVALVSALSRLRSLNLNMADVIKLSMLGEQEIHGSPSGIDSTVCAIGGALLFRPGSRPRRVRFKGRRTFLVVNTGKSRSTKLQIRRVSKFKKSYPKFFEGLIGSASELSLTAADRLASDEMKALGGLLTMNHAVLGTLGVSNQVLDGLVDLLLSLGCHGAKLTGAGGGGSVVAIAPKGKEKSIITQLEARGLETFKVDIPVEGVKSWVAR